MANKIEVKDLLEAGVHFGHMTRKWDPNMAPYIYMERNGIHIINLYKTAAKIEEANEALKKIAASGRKILFVATKKQAKDIVAEKAAAFSATMFFACFLVATNNIFLPDAAIFFKASLASSIFAAVLYRLIMWIPLRSI